MTEFDRAKVIVGGDSGVGKTALVHLIRHKEPLLSPSWTVGCSVEFTVHSYKAGTPHERPCFIELWDIGGSSAHANARSIFYHNVHGLILVYDLTNRKSEAHLKLWLAEVLSKHSTAKCDGVSNVVNSTPTLGGFFKFGTSDEATAGLRSRTGFGSGGTSVRDNAGPQNNALNLPVLVIGTKLDLVETVRPSSLIYGEDLLSHSFLSAVNSSPSQFYSPRAPHRSIDNSVSIPMPSFTGDTRGKKPKDKNWSFAADKGFSEILLSCNSTSDLAPDTNNAVILNHFFDQVMYNRLVSHNRGVSQAVGGSATNLLLNSSPELTPTPVRKGVFPGGSTSYAAGQYSLGAVTSTSLWTNRAALGPVNSTASSQDNMRGYSLWTQ